MIVLTVQSFNGQPVAGHLLGNTIANDQRPMRSRTHAVELQLEPGVPHVLLLEILTDQAYGTMIKSH